MPDTSYDGAAEVRRISDWIVTVSLKIGDVDDPGWLGQITSHWPAETFAPGPVTVTLHDGDRQAGRRRLPSIPPPARCVATPASPRTQARTDGR